MILLEGGHSVPRTYKTSNTSGSGIVQPLAETFKNLQDCELRTRCKFDEFVTDENGAIVGVAVRNDYKFDKNLFSDDKENKSGERKFIKAKKGVVLESGGFFNDKFFRKLQYPRAVP